MLQQFKTIITETAAPRTDKVLAASGALLACFSLMPPVLIFTCKRVTESCRRSHFDLSQDELNPARLKME